MVKTAATELMVLQELEEPRKPTGATGARASWPNATISVTNSTQPCSTGLTITGNGTSNLGLTIYRQESSWWAVNKSSAR